MVRFLSTEWIDAFNRALEGSALPGPDADAGLAVGDGPVVVAEEIAGVPGGDVRLLLHIDGGNLRLDRGEADAAVTVALSYRDAAAMSSGDLSPADALNEGRIRVRGDLTVLVEAQRLLAAARELTEGLAAETTY